MEEQNPDYLEMTGLPNPPAEVEREGEAAQSAGEPPRRAGRDERMRCMRGIMRKRAADTKERRPGNPKVKQGIKAGACALLFIVGIFTRRAFARLRARRAWESMRQVTRGAQNESTAEPANPPRGAGGAGQHGPA